MKNIYRHILLAVYAVVSALAAYGAVTMPRNVEVFMPKVLTEPLILESDIARLTADPKWGQGKSSTDAFWFVYSDRDNNPYYDAPSAGAAKLGTLKLNEKLLITKIQNGYALVIEEPKSASFPQISTSARMRGWVPMEKLLLWQQCPVDNNHIYRKAILAANDKDNQRTIVSTANLVFRDPSTNQGGKKVTSNLEFYYLMKKDSSGRYLLSKSHTLVDVYTDQALYGWVDPQAFVEWSQRSCLEPNWNQRSAEMLNNPSGTNYHFYVDPQLTQDRGNYQYAIPNDSDHNDITKYRMAPNMLRFPILNNETGNPNIYHVTCVMGRKVANAVGIEEKFRQEKERALQRMSHVNLIFVIDGTKSMGDYFNAVANSIKTALTRISDGNNTKKVGVVIYRDYADGDAMIEVQPCVDPDSPQLLDFLTNIGRKGYGAKSAEGDKTLEEALFMGLDAALDTAKMGYSSKNSNMMIVVGDAGNDPKDSRSPSQKQIIAKMIRNRINPMSFQVHRQDAPAFLLFNNQMSQIIGSTIRAQYQAIMDKDKEHKLRINAKIHNSRTGTDLTSDYAVDFYVGSLRKPGDVPGVMPTHELESQIDMATGLFYKAVEATRAALFNVGQINNSGAQSGVDMDEAVARTIFDESLFDEFKKGNLHYAYAGYVPKKKGSIKLWEAVVFLSTPELDNLIERLKPASEVDDAADRRQYIDALKGIVQAMLPDITNEQLDAMPLNEVSRRIAGLNEASEALSAYTLADLQNPQVVSDGEYLALINRFKQQYRNLVRIRSRRYPYSFSLNNNRYYWIPVRDMP